MVRFRDDIDGCGCMRCQDIEYSRLQPSLVAVFVWSFRLPVERPSIIVVFLVLGIAHLIARTVLGELVVLSAAIGVLAVFVGRGYVGVVGEAALGPRQPAPLENIGTVIGRLPSFLGAVLIVVVLLFTFIYGFGTLLPELVREWGQALSVTGTSVDAALLVFLAAGILFLLMKFWFVPEACFIGGYGPLESLYVSWEVTAIQRTKAAAMVGGFLGLLGLGVLLEAQLAGPRSPVGLSLRYQETTIVLRSFGFSTAGSLRRIFDLVITTIYSGVFAHQYITGVLET